MKRIEKSTWYHLDRDLNEARRQCCRYLGKVFQEEETKCKGLGALSCFVVRECSKKVSWNSELGRRVEERAKRGETPHRVQGPVDDYKG